MIYRLFFLIMVIAHNTYAQQEQSFNFDVSTQQNYNDDIPFWPDDQTLLDHQLVEEHQQVDHLSILPELDFSYLNSQQLQEGIQQSNFSAVPEKKS